MALDLASGELYCTACGDYVYCWGHDRAVAVSALLLPGPPAQSTPSGFLLLLLLLLLLPRPSAGPLSRGRRQRQR